MMTPSQLKDVFDAGYAGAWVDIDIISCDTDIADAAGIAAVAAAVAVDTIRGVAARPDSASEDPSMPAGRVVHEMLAEAVLAV